MSLAALTDATKDYAGRKVLDGVEVEIHDGDRIGLIGNNGCGKTTLLRVLTDEVELDSGSRISKRGLVIGYLPQIPEVEGGCTVLEEALRPFARLRRIEEDLARVEHAMGGVAPEELERLVHEQAALREEYEREGGYTYRPRTEAALHGLGLSDDVFGREVSVLSGGEKNRLGLAKLLVQEPDVLLLDEPTNYLDLDAVLWLEGFLAGYTKALVIVSHDRYFLDRTVGKIWELQGGKVAVYRGNYSDFRAQKEEREERLRKEVELQQREIERQEEFIRRNIAAQKTKQAQARRKQLEKLEILEAPRREKEVKIRFGLAERGGNDVLRLRGLGMEIEGRTLFRDLDLDLHRGDRVGIIGPNGTGKSTLLRILLRRVAPTTGEVKLGEGIVPGYYDQEHKELDPTDTLFDALRRVAPQWTDEEIRNYLGAFLFRGDEVYKRVGDASGGETGRVAIARIAILGSNFLVLDEPTNHLDIASRTVLEEALRSYEGTILMISHDRYLLDRTVQKLLVFRGGEVHLFTGNFSGYAEALRREEAERREEQERREAEERRRRRATERRAPSARKPARRFTYEALEARIMETEERIRELHAELALETTYRDPERVKGLKEALVRTEAELHDLEEEWETWV